MNVQDGSGPYIWLRYATQYTKDGRTHTFEMSIPVPVGADEEERARLFREAEANMKHLVSHVDRQMPQGGQRVAPMQGSVPVPNQGTKAMPPQRPVAPPNTRPATFPPAPSTSGHVTEQESAATRPSSGPRQTPAEPGVTQSLTFAAGESSGSLTLPEFIQYIKEYLNLTPRQAMELLHVKSLSTGINLRDALEQLKQLSSQAGAATLSLGGPLNRENEPPAGNTPPARSTTGQLSNGHSVPAEPERGIIHLREERPAYRFDEEADEDAGDLVGLEDLDDLSQTSSLTPAQIQQARTKISELRESQGATTASTSRLQALNNAVVSQIGEDQLVDLIKGIWNIPTLKRLKIDQVEALISWAKQDYFVDEVEAVMTILEEDQYARGNR